MHETISFGWGSVSVTRWFRTTTMSPANNASLMIMINTDSFMQSQSLPPSAETKNWLSLIQRCLLRVLASVLREWPLDWISLHSYDSTVGLRTLQASCRSLDDLSSSVYDLECVDSQKQLVVEVDHEENKGSIKAAFDALPDSSKHVRFVLIFDYWSHETVLRDFTRVLSDRSGYLLTIGWPEEAVHSVQLALEPSIRVLNFTSSGGGSTAPASDEANIATNVPAIAELANDIVGHLERCRKGSDASVCKLSLGHLSTRICLASSVYGPSIDMNIANVDDRISRDGGDEGDGKSLVSSRGSAVTTISTSTGSAAASLLPSDLRVCGFLPTREALTLEVGGQMDPLAAIPVVITASTNCSDPQQQLLALLNRSMQSKRVVAVVAFNGAGGSTSQLGILSPLAVCLQRDCK